jgi:26S proteasome regulatory subunit N5
VDYSSTCDEKIPAAQELAKAGKLNEALDMLLSLEKQTRLVSSGHNGLNQAATRNKLPYFLR